MARDKIDPILSRKAYVAATKALKEQHPVDFALALDEAYADLGVESPRRRRIRLESEAAEKRLLNAQKAEARKAEKIAAAKALLEDAGLTVVEG